MQEEDQATPCALSVARKDTGHETVREEVPDDLDPLVDLDPHADATIVTDAEPHLHTVAAILDLLLEDVGLLVVIHLAAPDLLAVLDLLDVLDLLAEELRLEGLNHLAENLDLLVKDLHHPARDLYLPDDRP
eukprot:TRINITY_DN4135_c0_g1_i1.p3 TRINITY_DN4135_c0_g1~~TRINITY_DN4135_c0_g1_i1.p3  ORF type:complete len:132 (+),score=37.23 TRINITY_DN4135_c0_g1_i1:244-639(+)